MSMNSTDGIDRSRPAARGERDVIYRFADCVLDARTLELRVAGQAARLEPKPLDLLIFLLGRPGEVVTKADLQDGVWPGRILSESVLTKTMTKLRQGLGDDSQQLIRTVHGFGYQLTATVAVVPAEAPAALTGQSLHPGDTPPLRPHWQLVERLGRGGFGDVWLARHNKTNEPRVFKFALSAPGLNALKREITLNRALRRGQDDRRDLARILDWNLEQAPFFVEFAFARHGSLAQWANQQGGWAQVPLPKRLELIAQAADALAAAHAAGVLHKDLKPSNLLVDQDELGRPMIQLADFGSGRMLDPEELDRLAITRLGFSQDATTADNANGTPAYFAPELLAGQPPSIRTDIFALGVLLYQVVIGDLTRPLAPGWETQIGDELLREDISTAAASDAGKRLADAGVLALNLRSLETRRAKREQDRAAIKEAERLRTHLAQARRRRSAAMVLAAGFAIASALFASMWLRMSAAHDAADFEREVASAVSDFLVDDFIGAADPLVSGQRDVSVDDMLAHGAQSVGSRFADLPAQESAVRLALGRAYLAVGQYNTALLQFDRAAELALGLGPAARPQYENVALQRLQALNVLDRNEDLTRDANALIVESEIGIQLRARQILARRQLLDGAIEESLASYRSLLPAFRSQFGPDSAATADLLEAYGLALRETGEFDAAVASLEEAAGLRATLFGPRDMRTLDARQSIGGTLYLAGRTAEAEAVINEALARAREVFGSDHYRTLIMQSDLASVLQAQSRFAEAEPLFNATLVGLSRQFGEDHKDTRTTLNNLGLLYEDLGRQDASIAMLKRAMDAELRVVGAQTPSAMTAINNYARALGLAGSWPEAEALQAANVNQAEAVLPAEHWQLAVLRYNWAHQLGHLGQTQKALALFDQAIAALSAQLGPEHPVTQRAAAMRADLLGRNEAATQGGVTGARSRPAGNS